MVAGKKKYGFINEKGTYGFDFNNPEESTYFIVSSIVIDKENLQQVCEKIEIIENRFLKDKYLIDEDLKWTMKKIALNDITELDIEIFSFIVNKERIKEEYGIKNDKEFLEFLNGILYTDIIDEYSHINLINKSEEEKGFLNQFNKYLIEKHSPDLLGEHDVIVIEEDNINMSFVLELINDVIYEHYQQGSDHKENEQCYEILEKIMISPLIWPRTPEEYIKNLKKYIREGFDEHIAYNSIRIAFDFIRNNGGTKNESKYTQILTLKYLLSILLNYGENRYLYSEEIRKKLSDITGKKYTAHYFQARIIAPLRDCGILIATSQKGYKIPIREREIISFINQSSSVIKPMVERIKICRESVLRATNNKVDVLDNDEYKYLREIIEINQ